LSLFSLSFFEKWPKKKPDINTSAYRFAQKLLDVRTIKARWSPSILSAIFR